jgi:two-component system LytT family response regulator
VSRRIRCLVADDEPLAREAIRACAAGDPSLEVAGEAADGSEALRAVESLRPDLLFLDVRMPEMDGFEILSALAERSASVPATIFVTAYDDYALRAFEAHALDYLLKPIREDRFRDAVAAARSRIAADQGLLAAERLAALAKGEWFDDRPRRLPVKANGRIELVPLDQIEWIESEGNYVRLHQADRSHLVRETMNGIEARLDPSRFFRIHRSAIVNVSFIRDLRPWFTGEYIVRLRNGKELTLTRTHRDALRRLMGKPAG